MFQLIELSSLLFLQSVTGMLLPSRSALASILDYSANEIDEVLDPLKSIKL